VVHRKVIVTALVSLLAATSAAVSTPRAEGQPTRVDSSSIHFTSTCARWGAWTNFKDLYVNASGRVIDYSSERRITVSEGQAYALFFSLVAGDKQSFESILKWTEDNLASGSLKSRLPAWHWGRRDDGTWGVLDPNSATDADLWIAYTLAQASRLWGVHRYGALSNSLAERLLRETTVEVPGIGLVLLPAPVGFGPDKVEGRIRARLNPSYLPLSVLRGMANGESDVRWRKIHESSISVLEHSAPKGFAPDWLTLSGDLNREAAGSASINDAPADRWGSYDAIRVYLWLGLMHADDPHRSRLLQQFHGMANSFSQSSSIPEKVDTSTGQVVGAENPGLGWALLPYLKASGRDAEFQRLEAVLYSLPSRFPAYYEDALRLFSSGHLDHRYRFDANGQLELARNTCVNVLPTPSRQLH